MNASEPESDGSKLVTIRTFGDELEASIAKGALDAFGIECMLSHDDCGGQRPHLSYTGGLRLLVKTEDAQSAAEVLSGGTELESPGRDDS